MLTFTDAASIAACPSAPVGHRLQELLRQRVAGWSASDLLDETELLIIQPEDTALDVKREISLCPLINPLDGSHFGSKDFTPHWEWLHRHENGWFEMMVTVGNDGFAYFLFIQDAEGVDPALLALCRTYAGVQP